MKYAVEKFSKHKNVEILWASTREVLNIYQAAECDTDIVTITPEIFKKIHLRNYNLENYHLRLFKCFTQIQ